MNNGISYPQVTELLNMSDTVITKDWRTKDKDLPSEAMPEIMEEM